MDSNPVEYLAQNTYNELSQLSGKKVGGTSPSIPLQDISYAYNIRGWMTGINKDLLNTPGEKLFKYEIRYNNPYNPDLIPGKYNGNIAEISWNDSGTIKRYSYTYDQLNRLTTGIFSNPNSTVPVNHLNDEMISYDLNGNITTLKDIPEIFMQILLSLLMISRIIIKETN